MFGVHAVKEIRNAIFDSRFAIAVILCVVFIPLGMYVTVREYDRNVSDYDESLKMYREKTEGNITEELEAEGFRPPSRLTLFAVGLDQYMPNKVVTTPNGLTRLINERGLDNSVSLLFGRIDLLFYISIIMSLLALIFTYDSISGEKELGTLKQIIANPVSRLHILAAKITANHVLLTVALGIGLLAGIVVLAATNKLYLVLGDNVPKFILIIIASLIFISGMINLGILVSTRTGRSSTSLVILLLFWLLFVLAIPKISPLIAQVIYPVESRQVVDIEKSLVMTTLKDELFNKTFTLFDNSLHNHGLSPRTFRFNPGKQMAAHEQAAFDEFISQRNDLQKEYDDRITSTLEKIEADYWAKRNTQNLIAANISRLSPVSCYNYIVSDLSGTGIHEINNLIKQAQRFQSSVKREIYDLFKIEHYGSSVRHHQPDNIDELEVPQMNDYTYLNTEDALRHTWIDFLLLAIYSILFFAAGYVSFLRYDVR